MNPAPSKYSAIKAIRFDKLNKTGDGSLKKKRTVAVIYGLMNPAPSRYLNIERGRG